uniref:Acetylcholinesterase n=1 Tax=Parastrongyloides trichosuri TaxID=131310 RepID=A0A0N4ZI23_PARTI
MWYLHSLAFGLWASYLSKFSPFTTNCGDYYGKILHGNKENGVIEFLGIPYAKPPIHDLRFSDPQEPKCNRKDRYVFDKYSHACPQLNFPVSNELTDIHFVRTERTSEDCLYLNMWVPKGGKLFPVIVFFHGGDFLRGTAMSDMYNGSYLSFTTKSIVITINYRLNVFGFAQSYQDINIHGNMGLKDQQMALKWINKNIYAFGGDKNKVTIFGIGSGAASVSAHLYAKDSFSYYTGAIMFSGHMANVKYTKYFKAVQKYTEKLTEKLGCIKKRFSPLDEMKCLRKKYAYEIIKVAESIYRDTYGFNSPFVISTKDNSFFKKDLTSKFITSNRYLAGFNTKAKILLGHTNDEGALDLLSKHYYNDFYLDKKTHKFYLKISNQSYDKIVYDVVRRLHLTPIYYELMKDSYNNITSNERKVIKMFTDLFTDCDLKKFVYQRLAFLNESTHVFRLNKSSTIKYKELNSWLGVTSKETIEYIFGLPFRYPNKYPKEKVNDEQKFSFKMMELIGNFSKNWTFDKQWFTSNLTTFKERIAKGPNGLGKYIIRESKFDKEHQNGLDGIVEFLGIPYALPPLGFLRFEDPVEFSPCNDENVFVSTDYPKACPQIDINSSGKIKDKYTIDVKNTSEDCLMLNLWKPKDKTNLPVLVFFHDGDFLRGSASLDMYNGSYLSEKTQSIVITVNYRLNVFGFAQSYGGINIHGNMGLKDQQMALRWINQNIYAFGGDKNKVTIFGIGSGAASVSAHLYAERSFPFYTGAIMFSGHMANFKYTKHFRTVQSYTEKLIERVGCRKRRRFDLEMECFKEKYAYQIKNEAEKIYKELKNNEYGSPFTISSKDYYFFRKDLTNNLIGRKRNLSGFNPNAKILLGHTGNEGALDLLKYHYHETIFYDKKTKKYNLRVSNAIYEKILHDVVKRLHLSDYEGVIKNGYMNISKNKEKVIRMYSDLFTDCDLKKFVFDRLRSGNKVSHVLMLNKSSTVSTKEKYPWLGATSEETIEYAFGNPFRHPEQYSKKTIEEEKEFSSKVMELIGNFTKTWTFDSQWKTSDFSTFKERVGRNAKFLEKYIISESNIDPSPCYLFEYVFKNSIIR